MERQKGYAMQSPKILDNKNNGRVVDEIRKWMGKDTKLSIISSYFTIYSFYALKKELSSIPEVRMILTDSSFAMSEKDMTEAKALRRNLIGGDKDEKELLDSLTQSYIARECAKWVKRKLSVRGFRDDNPAAMHMLLADNGEGSAVVQGTVDMTSGGLGTVSSARTDANVAMYGEAYTRQFLSMFDRIWEDKSRVIDIKEQILDSLRMLYEDQPPQFIYAITLYRIFKDYLDDIMDDRFARTGFYNSVIWNKLYSFQKDGAKGIISKLEKYNGCILADSVGLGKTFTALAVIKYYELRNHRVLVLAPKRLRDNWTIYTRNDVRNVLVQDRFNYDVLNHTDLSRTSGMSGDIDLASMNWGNYDLVVIDESHNFRNNVPTKDHITRYQRLMNDIIKAGVKTKVLMLSATPVNNRMNDIKNQIAFITEGNDTALQDMGISSIENVLRLAQTVFNQWNKTPDTDKSTNSFVSLMSARNPSYFRLLDILTIARSRKHISKYYDSSEIGTFPKRLAPLNLYPGIDREKEFPDIKNINTEIRGLTLAVYSPMAYLKLSKLTEYASRYDTKVNKGKSRFTQLDREQQLIGLIRVGMLKRMESSIHSFADTVRRIMDKIDMALGMMQKQKGIFDPSIHISDFDEDDSALETLAWGSSVKVLFQDIDALRWIPDLQEDRKKLASILLLAEQVTAERDEKLEALKNIIREKTTHPINQGNKKIIIFTAFADTANYLYDNLLPLSQSLGLHQAVIVGSGRNRTTIKLSGKSAGRTDMSTLLTLFSPISKEASSTMPDVSDRIDLLIATDCISEGQNLQDCDYLINYDIHWNPVRIIQRFGRIDRIGSRNKAIQLVNFWPMENLEEYISLEKRVRGRMVLLDVSATGEENVIEENSSEEMHDLEYRRTQLEQLKHQVLDLEDISGSISITDLTFNDFRMDLAGFMKEDGKALETAPRGLHAVIGVTSDTGIAPGAIFLLKDERDKAKEKGMNPFTPHILLYVTDDGKVQWDVPNSKKALDLMKRLCHSAVKPDEEALRKWNLETKEGRVMDHYASLLKQAYAQASGFKEEEGMASLFSRGGLQITGGIRGSTGFTLEAFLILEAV